jgi:hypothetical protein
MKLCDPLQEFREKWPAIFAGTSLGSMTKEGYRYRSLLNEISRGDAPRDILMKDGKRKNLIVRDKFLDHWQSKLKKAAAQ